VTRLKGAGAIVVSKTNTYVFALGHENSFTGQARNPRAPDHGTGGSSSGSAAAVAAGQVPVAIASDTGGSIRIPSGWCGIYGLKPTHGRVPTTGVMPLSWSLDTVGPM